MASEHQKDALIVLVHQLGMAIVIQTLAEIAGENAKEVEWENKEKAKHWYRVQKALLKCASLPAIGLS